MTRKREIVLKPEKTCRRNPQLGPHNHHRENGILICEGMVHAEAVPKREIKVVRTQGYTDYLIWKSSK